MCLINHRICGDTVLLSHAVIAQQGKIQSSIVVTVQRRYLLFFRCYKDISH